jgi:hypothetical protein
MLIILTEEGTKEHYRKPIRRVVIYDENVKIQSEDYLSVSRNKICG